MRAVGPRLSRELATPRVPLPHEERIALKRRGSGELFRPPIPPETARAPKRRDSARRRDPGARDDRDAGPLPQTRGERAHPGVERVRNHVPMIRFRARRRRCAESRYAEADERMANEVPITVAHGDGIGPEIMAATLHILKAAGAAHRHRGRSRSARRSTSPATPPASRPSAWESLRRTKVFLKAPITTPQGGGYKSLNVTTRKTLGLYANVRPCVSYHPFVATKHPVHGRRHRPRERRGPLRRHRVPHLRPTCTQCLKLITRPGSEKIVRYAFEYARRNNRKKVTCFTKDNIMKMTDGLFHKVFDEIGDAVSGHREGALDRRHRRGQARRHARGLRRHRHAEPLRRHPLRRRGPDRRLGRPGGLGQHRRATAPCSRRSTARRPGARARTWRTRRACCSAP